jgi:hypothetical protein
MDGLNVACFTPFPDIELDETFSDIVSFKKVVLRRYNIPQKRSSVHLGAMFP